MTAHHMNEKQSRAWHPEHVGWSTDIIPFLSRAADLIPQGGAYLECGVFFGRSLAFLGSIRPDIQLFALDPWADGESQGYTGPGEYEAIVNHRGGLYATFKHMMATHAPEVKFTELRGTTANLLDLITFDEDFKHNAGFSGRPRLPPLDLVFIDGAHDYANVVQDIAVLTPLVKTGGIVSGHDYNVDFVPESVSKDDGRLGVINAVREAFPDRYQIGMGPAGEWSSCWWAVKQ